MSGPHTKQYTAVPAEQSDERRLPERDHTLSSPSSPAEIRAGRVMAVVVVVAVAVVIGGVVAVVTGW